MYRCKWSWRKAPQRFLEGSSKVPSSKVARRWSHLREAVGRVEVAVTDGGHRDGAEVDGVERRPLLEVQVPDDAWVRACG